MKRRKDFYQPCEGADALRQSNVIKMKVQEAQTDDEVLEACKALDKDRLQAIVDQMKATGKSARELLELPEKPVFGLKTEPEVVAVVEESSQPIAEVTAGVQGAVLETEVQEANPFSFFGFETGPEATDARGELEKINVRNLLQEAYSDEIITLGDRNDCYLKPLQDVEDFIEKKIKEAQDEKRPLTPYWLNRKEWGRLGLCRLAELREKAEIPEALAVNWFNNEQSQMVVDLYNGLRKDSLRRITSVVNIERKIFFVHKEFAPTIASNKIVCVPKYDFMVMHGRISPQQCVVNYFYRGGFSQTINYRSAFSTIEFPEELIKDGKIEMIVITREEKREEK